MKKLLALLGIVLLTVSCGSDDSSDGILDDVEDEKRTWTIVYEQEGDKEDFNQTFTLEGNWKNEPEDLLIYQAGVNLADQIEHESENL